MLSKAEIARYLNKEVNASKSQLVQFLHSTFYKEGLDEEQYLLAFNSFIIDLDEFLIETKDWGLHYTFLKDRPFTTLKIPKKVLKQMEEEHIMMQNYIQSVIDEINEQD
tara:strand:- start:335 stop:661 length:327 start_codon:yes stop_codon:yes gene_type:complete